ncbi:MAG: mannose-1-phosphate guanylyltransferase/mannose-6-phosphate isomerase [Bacillota bacterium]|nr:mannose-1-phosphate guanylyltransferase/mannose-6-phosphate isomerase [Bacillota bacterium]
MYAIILAGGSGTRLWPISRELYPKQFLQLPENLKTLKGEIKAHTAGETLDTTSPLKNINLTLIQATVRRVLAAVPEEKIIVITHFEQADEIRRQIMQLGHSKIRILEEPEACNTAPAIGLAATLLDYESGPDEIMAVLPSDHLIPDHAQFVELMKQGEKAAEEYGLVTFGIKPTYPETGYGYICTGEKLDDHTFKIHRFVEKPDLPTAKIYMLDNRYLWNSGMFIFNVGDLLDKYEELLPEMYDSLKKIYLPSLRNLDEIYPALQKISIDYGILEAASDVTVIPTDIGWSDLGSWDAYYQITKKDENLNYIRGNVIPFETEKSLIISTSRLVGTVGLNNMVVIDTEDALLICDRDNTQDVKKVVDQLKKEKAVEAREHRTIYRPWGSYTSLEVGGNYQIKRINVNPGSRLSLQSHKHRSENWIVVEGEALVTVNDRVFVVKKGETAHIPKEGRHRMENKGPDPLTLIEVQYGEYLGEDDIERYEDDYGRAGSVTPTFERPAYKQETSERTASEIAYSEPSLPTDSPKLTGKPETDLPERDLPEKVVPDELTIEMTEEETPPAETSEQEFSEEGKGDEGEQKEEVKKLQEEAPKEPKLMPYGRIDAGDATYKPLTEEEIQKYTSPDFKDLKEPAQEEPEEDVDEEEEGVIRPAGKDEEDSIEDTLIIPTPPKPVSGIPPRTVEGPEIPFPSWRDVKPGDEKDSYTPYDAENLSDEFSTADEVTDMSSPLIEGDTDTAPPTVEPETPSPSPPSGEVQDETEEKDFCALPDEEDTQKLPPLKSKPWLNDEDYIKPPSEILLEKWITHPELEPSMRRELLAMKENIVVVDEHFGNELEFGTGGMRGLIGPGLNRVNIYTIRRATQGLANYINKQSPSKSAPKVAIAYDTRHHSAEFAEAAALVLAANGIKALLFKDIRPTPLLSFATRELKCAAGIVITASHNPSDYNGYKVYSSDGGQAVSPFIDELISEITQLDIFDDVKTIPLKEAVNQGLIKAIDPALDKYYLEKVKSLSLTKPEKCLKAVFTPLHGTGSVFIPGLLTSMGCVDLVLVEEQMTADPEFSTVRVPNPEDPAALQMALEKAAEVKADLILATDPDCDRVGTAVRDTFGRYVILSGNQVGALLIEYICSNLVSSGKMPISPALVKTIVTGDLGRKVAESYDLHIVETLTGFKFIGDKIRQFEEEDTFDFIFGYEESYGYLAGTFVRDKDAVIASLLIAEMTAFYKQQGKSLLDVLDMLHRRFGFFREDLLTVELKDISLADRHVKAFRNLPAEVAGNQVIEKRDYELSKGWDLANNREFELTLPKSKVLHYTLGDGSWFAVRPSGTEPKVKFYLSVSAPTASEADHKLGQLRQAIKTIC